MKPVTFKGVNIELGPPCGQEAHCETMQAFRGTMYNNPPVPVIISCHELDSDELLHIIETRRVYVTTMGANRSPVLLTTANPIEEGWAQ